MSVLSYKDFFDFDEYEARLDKLSSAHAAFAASVARGVGPIEKSYEGLVAQLKLLQAATKELDVRSGSAKISLTQITQATTEYISRAKAHKEVLDLLSSSVKINEQSVTDLKAGLVKLKSDYEGLNPTVAGFAEKQAAVKVAVQAATDQINAQLAVVKAAKKSVDAATGSYAHLSKQTGELRASLRQMDGAFDLSTGKINKNNIAATEMLRQIKQNDAALKRMDASMGNHQRNVGNYTSAFGGLKGNLLLAGGAMLGISSGFEAISQAVQVIDRMERLNNSMKAISSSTDEFNKRQAFVRGLANQTGTEIEKLTSSYIQFTAATRDTSLEGAKGDKVFAAFSKSFSALGASSATAERGLNAIQQMVSKGKVSAEELRQQLAEALPGSFKLFADAMGVSTTELDKMLKKGEVLAGDVLPKVAIELEKLYGASAQKNLTTIGGSWANVTNQVKFFLDSLNSDGVISKFFARINNGLAGVISRFTAIQSNFNDVQARVASTRAERGPIESFWKDGIIGKTQDYFDAAQKVGKENEKIAKRLGEFNQIPNVKGRIDAVMQEQKALADLDKQYKEHRKTGEGLIFQSDQYKQKTVALSDAIAEQKRIVQAMVDQRGIAAAAPEISHAVLPDDGKAAGAAKRVQTEYEKLLGTIGKLRDVLVDETLADIKAGRTLSLPRATLDKWNDLYAILEKTAELTGGTLPRNIVELNQKLNPALLNLAKEIKFTQGSAGIEQDAKEGKVDLGVNLDKHNEKLQVQEAERRILQEQLTTGALRNIKQKYKDDLIAIQAEIHKAEVDGTDAELKTAKDKHDRILDMIREEKALRKEIAEQSIQLAGQTIEALFEINGGHREAEMEQNRKSMENELAMAGDNLSAQSRIKADFAEKDLELRRKQAKADKAQALFSIAINTAVAISKALPNFILSAFAGAAGLIQAAIVLAKPLPAFWTGTQNAPEGLATVAERGPEIRESKGKRYLYDRPQITHLHQGDKIYNADQTRALVEQSMRRETINDILQRQATGRATSAQVSRGVREQTRPVALPIDYNRMGGAFASALDGRPVHETTFDENGVTRRLRQKSGMTTYQNKRYSLK